MDPSGLTLKVSLVISKELESVKFLSLAICYYDSVRADSKTL